MGYDGLLLDHDGVIVSLGEREALTRAAREALRDVGVAEPDPAAVETFQVSVEADDLARVAEDLEVDPATLWRHRDDRVAEALRAEVRADRKVPYDDASVLRDLSLPVGVVSNNQTRVVEFVLDHYDLRAAVDTVRAREPTPASLARKKPEPTYLEAAMETLGVETPLYVGDSESDVIAGRRAGVDVAFIRRAHRDGQELGVEPDFEVSDLHEVGDLLGTRAASDTGG